MPHLSKPQLLTYESLSFRVCSEQSTHLLQLGEYPRSPGYHSTHSDQTVEVGLPAGEGETVSEKEREREEARGRELEKEG